MDRYAGFTEFVVARERALLRVAYLLTTDVGLAEDLLQAALAKTAIHWPRIRDGNPEGYVRRVLYTESVSWWRHRRGMQELATDDVADRPTDDGGEDVERRMVVAAALRRLTPRQRAVIVLRFYEDLSVADVAAALGCTSGTVKSQTHDALIRLRAVAPELADLETTPEEVQR